MLRCAPPHRRRCIERGNTTEATLRVEVVDENGLTDDAVLPIYIDYGPC